MSEELEEFENEAKLYKVRVTAEWEIEVEAMDDYEAESLAEDYVHGRYGFELVPEYFDCWAEEL